MLTRTFEESLLEKAEWPRHSNARTRRERTADRFSPAKFLLNLIDGHLEYADYKTMEERAGSDPFDRARPPWTFDDLYDERDLIAATAPLGGYAVGSETRDPVDLLPPSSPFRQGGLIVQSGLVGNQLVPRCSGSMTFPWIPTEGTQATGSDPSLQQIALTPKTVVGLVKISRQLLLQSTADLFVRLHMRRGLTMALETAMLNGSGASGEPTGILNTTGIGVTTGTALAQAGVVEMKRKSSDANVNDSNITFTAPPAIRELLEKRERATGSGMIWDGDRVASRPAFATTSMPSATMLCGDFSLCFLGIWGQGFVLEADPSSDFRAQKITFRMVLTCDLAVLLPAAFVKAAAVT